MTEKTTVRKKSLAKVVVHYIPGGEELIKLWPIKYGKDESHYRDRV